MSAIDLKVRVAAVGEESTIYCTVQDLLKDKDIKKYATAKMLIRINECLDTLKIDVSGNWYPVKTYFQPECVTDDRRFYKKY